MIRAPRQNRPTRGWNLSPRSAAPGCTTRRITIDAECGGKSWFGWPCDEGTQKLRQTYVDAPDEAARRAALVALQAHLWQAVPVVPVGQYVQPFGARSTLSGILKSHIIVFWNIAKS